MALFDNLTKKVSEAGQKTIAKTKELMDTTKINTMISEKEKSINNTYFQIGKLYVALHKDAYEEDFSGLMAALAESEAAIKGYKMQLQEIKRVRHCEKCGAEVPIDAGFCSACGCKMPKAAETIPDDCIRCASCGALVKKGMRFCTACGTKIVMPAQEEQPEELKAEEKAEDTVEEKICPFCGAKLEADALFCMECGQKVT